MKEYTIVKRNYDENMWENVPKLKIDTFWWADNGYEPETTAQVCYDNENIYIKFVVTENEVTAKYKNYNDPAWLDSCVEFFLRPACDKRYFNFEATCIGTLLLGFGEDRDNRLEVDTDPAIFSFKPSITDPETFSGPFWTLEYKIPFSFLKEYWGEFDLKEGLFANCYKCGDETKYEHYGMWNPCEKEKPDFHRPDCFGRMYFEI